MSKPRIDKWLWAVRIFKTRTLAANTIKQGKVKINDKTVKASALVDLNQVVSVKKGGFDLSFKVLKVIDKRVGAPLAAECYEDLTPASEYDKFKEWYVGKSLNEFRDKGTGRPTKKDRREIDEYKDRVYDFWDDEVEE